MKGFTLIELIVVVAIIGILSTIMVVQYNNDDPAGELSQNREKMVSVLQLTRNYATTGHECNDCYGYGLYLEDSNYSIYSDGTAEGNQKYDSGGSDDNLADEFMLDNDVFVYSCNGVLTGPCDLFFSLYEGRVYDSGSELIGDYEIVLKHQKDSSFEEKINISGLSGKIE